MIVTIGTNDTLASPGAQLDYYQSVLDKMGRRSVDRFARLFVMPQTGHGLSGSTYTVDGTGKDDPGDPDSQSFRSDPVALRLGRERHGAFDVGRRQRRQSQLPLCSYPAYPKYVTGPAENAASIDVRSNAGWCHHAKTRRLLWHSFVTPDDGPWSRPPGAGRRCELQFDVRADRSAGHRC
jgi:hypothetical protein